MPPRPAIPDLSRYHLIHGAMRVADDQLVAGIARSERGDRRRAAALSRWFDGYAAELRLHHRVEDEIYFPALGARVPAHAECAPLLAADHERVDHLLDATLAALADAGGRWDRLHGDALAQAGQLRDLLAAHRDVEDADVLPLFGRHFDADEYAALHAQALKRVSPRQWCFTVAWLAATVEPAVAARELASAPRAIRLIWRATRRRYARLARRAFGPASAAPAANDTPVVASASAPCTEQR
jgi:hemerythrin-like domain-containing protein